MTRTLIAIAILGLIGALGAQTAQPAAEAASPGNNGVIAYESVTAPAEAYAYKVSGSGGASSRITSSSNFEFQPIYSPDGSKIAFTALRGGNLDIYTMNADGSGERRVTTHPGNDASATWSPDGSRLVFDTSRDGNFEIYMINADGSGEFRLTNTPGVDEVFPVWSPNGLQMIFSAFVGDGGGDIWVIGIDGSAPLNLTNHPANEFLADWSPDGTRVAFQSERTGNIDIWSVSATGGSPTQLTNNTADDMHPAWSPDGSRIAFSSERDGNLEIYVMNANGSGQTRLTNGPNDDWHPDWQPLTCTIAVVHDGESFDCTNGKRVRMLQMDAQNPGECGGGWAKAALANIFLTPGRVVRLQYDATLSESGADLAAPIAIGTDGAVYNISIVMLYVGLAKSATIGAGNTSMLTWANASQGWAQAAQWNMWAPGKTYTGGCD